MLSRPPGHSRNLKFAGIGERILTIREVSSREFAAGKVVDVDTCGSQNWT